MLLDIEDRLGGQQPDAGRLAQIDLGGVAGNLDMDAMLGSELRGIILQQFDPLHGLHPV